MKFAFLGSLLLFINSISFAQCSDLFFSEYIEGSSSNKAFEVYNPTNETIDLTDYVIYRNNNGSLTPTDSLFPQGNLEAGDVFVTSNPSAALSFLFVEADTFHTMTFYNGDDALWLKKISTGDTLDIIGDIGVDPGSGWPVGSGATNNFTLIRQIYNQQGETNWTLASTQWDVFPIDMDDSLGTHHMISCYHYQTIDETACDSLISPSENYVWETSDIYLDTIFTPGPFVRDTVFTINATILNSTFASIDTIICDSLISPSEIYTWETSGVYTDTILNAIGCDSIITVNLTILNSSGSINFESVCDSFTSPSGETWTSSGVYSDTIPNALGCDSIIVIDLTVNYSTMRTLDIGACKHYISPSGQFWDSPGTYMDTIPNLAGCDSVLTINLTIYHVDVTVTQTGIELLANNPLVSYQWLDCDNDFEAIDGETNQLFIAEENGSYAVIVSQDGCTDTSNCFTISEVGILENDFGNGLAIYPNPTQGAFSINLGQIESDITVEIYNISGILLSTETVKTAEILNLNIDGSSGVYFVAIRTGNNKGARIKVLKE